MFGHHRTHLSLSILARNSAAIVIALAVAGIGAAQDFSSAAAPALPWNWVLRPPAFSRLSSLLISSVAATRPGQPGSPIAAGLGDASDSADGRFVRSAGPRRVTLQQVQQQSANRAASSLAYLSHLSVEAAKQHRLAVQADYYPKFSANFLNLHTTDFLGQIVQVRRPVLGISTQFPVQIVNQNSTAAALTMVQPITPLFQVREAARIARANERIAMAKAAASVSKNAHDTEIEETYFKLLIAQRRLTSAEWKLTSAESRPLYASASASVVRVSGQDAAAIELEKAVGNAAAAVKELTASLNRLMGWPVDTELELAVPDPLVENISLQEISDTPPALNPALVEAEETVVKARAAHSLAKLAYLPTVAAVGGYLFQNAFPAVNSNFGYGGVIASYTLFDFGKREHTVKAARAQLEMAETALQLTRAKLAADVKESYFELERARQLSQVAQRMGSSAAMLMKVSAASDSLEVRAARADMELEMLEADFAHRQAFRRLKTLMAFER